MSRQYILEEWEQLWNFAKLTDDPEAEAAAKQMFFAGAIATSAVISRAAEEGEKQFDHVVGEVMRECKNFGATK